VVVLVANQLFLVVVVVVHTANYGYCYQKWHQLKQ
jgi:hypothetical protein